MIILGIFAVLILGLLLPFIDANRRVDGGEWRVRPSESGKTWEAYRYAGFLQVERYTRFKNPEAAAAFIRRQKISS
jgi:hypothetical protein